MTISPRVPHLTIARRRPALALALFGVIAAGYGSRTFGAGIPWIGKELGGVLWAAMFYLIAVLIAPRLPPAGAAVAAFCVAAGTEFLQLYKAPWIEAVRANRLGAVVLGHSFAWRDVACYAVGAVAAWAFDRRAASR